LDKRNYWGEFINDNGSRAVYADELPRELIIWASKTEMSTDTTRAKASLGIILSIENRFLVILLLILHPSLTDTKEDVICITKKQLVEPYLFISG